MESIENRLMKNVFVRVTKMEPDDRTSICGEKIVGQDDKGRDFFVIPVHQAGIVGGTFPRYHVSEDFCTKDGKPLSNAAPEVIARCFNKSCPQYHTGGSNCALQKAGEMKDVSTCPPRVAEPVAGTEAPKGDGVEGDPTPPDDTDKEETAAYRAARELLSGKGLSHSSFTRAMGKNDNNHDDRTQTKPALDEILAHYGEMIEKKGQSFKWKNSE